MSRAGRYAVGAAMLLAAAIAVAGPARAFCVWGFGRCESASPIAGEYVQDGNPSATLSITADKITSKAGPVSFSVNYTTSSVEGKVVTIEVSPPEPKEKLQIEVEKDFIKFSKGSTFAGDWKRSAGGR